MKKHISKVMIIFVVGFMAASPVFAHCGKCGMDDAGHKTAMKQCDPGCDKPCCKMKKDKICSTHGVKDRCCKKRCDTGKKNFGPRVDPK